MSRLTTNIREKMAEALVRHRYNDRAAELMNESVAIFIAAYEHHYDAKTREHIKSIHRKHKNAFAMTGRFDVNCNGPKFTVGNQKIAGRWTPEGLSVPTLNDALDYRFAISLLDVPQLMERAVKFAQDRDKFKEEVENAYCEALGTLRQFTSGKQLAKDWPEALPIIGSLIPEDNRNLPVIQVAKLNDKFGLPVADKS